MSVMRLATRTLLRDPLLSAVVREYHDAAARHDRAHGARRRAALRRRYRAADNLASMVNALANVARSTTTAARSAAGEGQHGAAVSTPAAPGET